MPLSPPPCPPVLRQSTDVPAPDPIGPYPTTTPGSGLPKISTPCGDVSESLLVEFTNGASFIITYVVGFDYWYGFTPDRFACDSQAGALIMYCDGVDWHIGPVASFNGPDDAVVVPTSLDPFFLSYTGPDTTCPPTVTLVITEIP